MNQNCKHCKIGERILILGANRIKQYRKMTEFVSQEKKIPYSDESVFRVVSDLSKLDLVKDKLPEDRISDFWCDTDSCSFSVDPFGSVTFVVMDREPSKNINFKSQGLPFNVYANIHLESSSENETLLKLTVRADLNTFVKQMVSTPMREGIDKLSEILASLSYDEI